MTDNGVMVINRNDLSRMFSSFQDLLREFGGLHVISSFLSDPEPDVRVQTLNALNNLSMNICNLEQLKVCFRVLPHPYYEG